MIINNMFQAYTQKLKIIWPTYLVPIASTQIKTTVLFGYMYFDSDESALQFLVHYTYFNVQNVDVSKIKTRTV